MSKSENHGPGVGLRFRFNLFAVRGLEAVDEPESAFGPLFRVVQFLPRSRLPESNARNGRWRGQPNLAARYVAPSSPNR